MFQQAIKAKGTFYEATSNFFNLKTQIDKNEVNSYLKTFKNFQIRSKSPQPETSQQTQLYQQQLQNTQQGQQQDSQQDSELDQKLELKQIKQQKQLQATKGKVDIYVFQPSKVINFQDKITLEAVQNLGLDLEELKQDVVITDFYNIKESNEMQQKRYFIKVQEIIHKIKAVQIEKQRLEQDQLKKYDNNAQTKINFNNYLTQNVIKYPQKIASLEEIQNGFYSQKLLEAQKKEQKELDLWAKIFKDSEIKVESLQQKDKKEIQQAQMSRTQEIQTKKQFALKQIAHHQETLKLLQEKSKEDEQLRKKMQHDFNFKQQQYIEQKEKKQTLQEKLKYLKDQKDMMEILNYSTKRAEKSKKEQEECILLQQKIIIKQQIANQRKDLLINQSVNKIASNQNNWDKMILQKQLDFQEQEQKLIQNIGVKYYKQQKWVEKVRTERSLEIQQNTRKQKFKNKKIKVRINELNYEFENHLVEKEKNLTSRILTSQMNKRERLKENSNEIHSRLEERDYIAKQRQEFFKQNAELRNQEIVNKEIQKKHQIKKEDQEYENFIQKKLLIRVEEKFKREQLWTQMHQTSQGFSPKDPKQKQNNFNDKEQKEGNIQQAEDDKQENFNHIKSLDSSI